jgi:hypothetical protein
MSYKLPARSTDEKKAKALRKMKKLILLLFILQTLHAQDAAKNKAETSEVRCAHWQELGVLL